MSDEGVCVPADDLRLVLNQRRVHTHSEPGFWDGPDPNNKMPCVQCAARARLRAALEAIHAQA